MTNRTTAKGKMKKSNLNEYNNQWLAVMRQDITPNY